LIRANKTGSDVQTFTMAPQSLENGRTAALLYRFDGESVIWYIGEQNSDVCLDLIVQKRNHTLIVNNNAETNGGHTFVEYTWFKDGVEILAENTLGYYYTQLDNDADSLLDTQAQYYARMTDSEGTVYNTCPYTPTMLTDFTIKVYPNPVQVQKEVSVDLEGLDWKTTTITVYDSDGRLVLKQSAQGDKTRVVMPRTVGVYMVKIQSGGMLKYTNIVVM
jgi:hypothetical protein